MLNANPSTSPMNAELQRVLGEFEGCGLSVADWARLRGFSLGNVYRVLRGEQACRRGEAYRIAIALGLKHGQILTPEQLDQKLRTGSAHAQVKDESRQKPSAQATTQLLRKSRGGRR